MCLCFPQASQARQKGEDTYEQYLDHLLVHCNGWASAEHKMDVDGGDEFEDEDDDEIGDEDQDGESMRPSNQQEATNAISKLKSDDIFTWVIWKWSRNTKNSRIDIPRGTPYPLTETLVAAYIETDIELYKKIFLAYPDAGKIQKLLESVKEDRDAPYITLALAHRALNDCNGDVLRFCLERELFSAYSFQEAADEFEKKRVDPAICEILQQSRFRKNWPWPIQGREREIGIGDRDVSVFDYGGEFEVGW